MLVEKNLHMQDTRAKQIVMQIADAVFIVNKLGVVVDCIVDYASFTNLRKDQFIGLPIWEVFKLIQLEDSLFKRVMDITDLPLLHQAAHKVEKSTQVITRSDGEKLYAQAQYFVIDEEPEKMFCIAIREITNEYMQKYHLERNRVRLRMMVKQRTEEFGRLNQELQKLNQELSEQIKEKVKAQDLLAEMIRAQAMADSEKRFRNIVDKLQDVVMIFNKRSIVTYVTPSCQTAYGYSEDEIIGRSVFSFVHPDDIARAKVYANSVLKTEEIVNCDCRVRHKNGDWANVKTVTVNMLDNQHINGYVLTCTDVTEQAKAQQHIEYHLAKQRLLNQIMVPLQKTEIIPALIDDAIAKVGLFADVGNVFILEKSYDGKSSSITFEWCNTGVDAHKDRLQQISTDLFNPWNLEQAPGLIHRYPGSICHTEMQRDNTYLKETILPEDLKSLIAIPLYVNGDLCGYLGFSEFRHERNWSFEEENLLINFAQIISSILQRQQSERAQFLLQQALITVLDNMPFHVYVVEKENHEILFANRNVRDNKQGLVHLRKKMTKIDQAYEEYDAKTDTWTYCVTTPITWIDERLVYLRIHEDITKRKKMELELLQAKDQAEESDKLKSAFLSNVSHEIRTPINAIIGYAQLLSKKFTSNELKKYSEDINDNCHMLVKLIDDIIDISTIEANQMKLEFAPCKLADLFDEIKTYYRQQKSRLNKDKVELLFDDLPHDEIITDSFRLRQIIGNLMDNALRSTDKGFVKLSCTLPGDGWIHFSVSDSGIGIPENQQQVIFERFRQLEQLRNLSGTGLVLAISKGLTELMGGNMSVKSTVGEGATFDFSIKA